MSILILLLSWLLEWNIWWYEQQQPLNHRSIPPMACWYGAKNNNNQQNHNKHVDWTHLELTATTATTKKKESTKLRLNWDTEKKERKHWLDIWKTICLNSEALLCNNGWETPVNSNELLLWLLCWIPTDYYYELAKLCSVEYWAKLCLDHLYLSRAGERIVEIKLALMTFWHERERNECCVTFATWHGRSFR